MISIRKASLKDVVTIVKLWKEFMKYHDEICIRENPKLKPYLIKKNNAANNFKKFVQKNIRSKNSLVSIAEVDGKPAGYSLIYIKNNIPVFELRKLGYISDLFVNKKFTGMELALNLKTSQ